MILKPPSAHQSEQLRLGLTAPVSILAGTPGTGKTHCAAWLLSQLARRWSASLIGVAAPTGKAAVRISEKMRDAQLGLQAQTIHRLLGFAGEGFEYHEKNPLPYRAVLIDEASMVDTGLAAGFLRACAPGTHILWVGDPYQLPPVGHGAVLRDMIASGKIPIATLTEIQRNAGAIVKACAAIKDGLMPEIPTGLPGPFVAGQEDNLRLIPLGKEPDALHRRLAEIYAWCKAQNRWDPTSDVQVICARNTTRHEINLYLQQALNPDGDVWPGTNFRKKDKIICLENGVLPAVDCNHDRDKKHRVANGDIGIVVGFRNRQMLVRFGCPDRLVAVPLGKKGQAEQEFAADNPDATTASKGVDLAWVCTGHKYQGSECKVVVVILEGAGLLASRELIYTDISRGREMVIVIGDRRMLRRYIDNSILPRRKTLLREMLRGEMTL